MFISQKPKMKSLQVNEQTAERILESLKNVCFLRRVVERVQRNPYLGSNIESTKEKRFCFLALFDEIAKPSPAYGKVVSIPGPVNHECLAFDFIHIVYSGDLGHLFRFYLEQ